MSYPYPGQDAPVHGRSRRRRLLVVGAAVALALAVGVGAAWHPSTTAAARNSVTILGASAASFDPAVQADAGSAQIVSQIFESLTAIDTSGRVQPALAASWAAQDGGKQVVFHLRPGLVFSDGSALTAADVVSSWMRVLAPAQPSQLASLLDDVVGAQAYSEGSGTASGVGLRAVDPTDVEVDLVNPAADFPAIASSPTLAVVPPGLDSDSSLLEPGSFVGSGAYVLAAVTSTETTLTANSHYWAGTPAITTVHLLSSIGGQSPVSEFQAGDLDYTPISLYDASWIAYDSTLGPSLRIEPSPSVEYYGFDTTKAPFNDVHVRRAFEMGIDWRRIVALLSDPLEVPATSMVPIGVPGHSSTDYGPKFDLATARSELAAAGYPNGAGFPKITLVTAGASLDGAIIQQLHDNLGIDIDYQIEDWASYNERLLTDPPAFWEMDWVADYPGANDFLGLLLGSGKTNNFARWSSTDFDAATAGALAATDPASMQAAFDRAESIVQDQAPVIPVDYGSGYSLAANGLLGAVPNGQGLVRYAGMAWAAGS
ncbi:MAG: peptide ABC transporter substrate-binding protein [Candidatus Limnocylindrales bacterium]|jgi:oligopeptide transport system substrate-binding protein